MTGRARSVAPLLVFTLLVSGLPGCGYTLVRKSDTLPRHLAADSAQIATLQRQLATLQARYRTDSTRYHADSLRYALLRPSVVSDSLLRAKDDEIASLRDQVSKLTVELDRIKRRLASPRP